MVRLGMVAGKEKNRMKKALLTISLIIVLGFLLFFLKGHRIDLSQEHNDANIPIPHGGSVHQSFRPEHNGLYEIEIGNLVNKAITRVTADNESFEFRLIDEKGTVVRSLGFSSQNIGDGSPLTIVFPIIPDSAGAAYTFELQSLDNPLSTKPMISVGSSNSSLYFRTYYKNRLIFIIADSLHDFFRRLNQDSPFMIAYLTLIALTLGFLVTGKSKK